MIVYTVHEPGQPAQNIEERADDIVFIKEGFTWWGFLFGPLWLLFNRLWFEFALVLLVAGVVAAGLVQLGLKDQAPGIVSWLLMLLIGFEGNDLRRWRLERKGYAFLASVAGRDPEECERRFFDAWLPHAGGRNGNPLPRPAMDLKPSSSGDWRGPGVIGTLPDAMA
jgi:hypothetical protein